MTIKFSLLFDGKQENKQFLGKEILMDIFREKRNFIGNKTKIFSACFEWLSLMIHLIAVLGVLNYLKTKKQMFFFSIVNAKVTHLILYNHNDFFLNLQNAKMITQGHRVMNAVATFNSLDYFLLNFLFKHFRFQYTRMYERTHKTTTSNTLKVHCGTNKNITYKKLQVLNVKTQITD